MFYLVGLGLGDVKDITVHGLEIVKKSKRVYLEAYTSVLQGGQAALEEFYGRDVILADRDTVELQSDELLTGADEEDVTFLVVGDPLGATTHTDLILRAIERNIPYKVIHNASIMNAVGCCGLQLYTFGETVSIVFWTDTWRPHSFFDKIAANKERGLHTLCLLDIKMKEQTIENLMKGRKIYEPPRFMMTSQAAEQIVEVIEKRREECGSCVLSEDSVCVGLARVGLENQKIVVATLKQMTSVDLGGPLHSLIIPGNLHPLESDMLRHFALDDTVHTQLKS
ncbi:diphthine methyl ester synthase-like [Gigantopelta aegis]|uniref:diphthine methyl ester synthase-like n=1 Tax=Gigantopelta aegis TaxID=1735272 RepID=UPI001B8888B2|nr:diphthine methyl ester synthase-like [Gigantopelta aegis]